MPINKDKKVLFVHIPKTGGSTIEKFFDMTNKTNRADYDLLFGVDTRRKNVNYDIALQHLTFNEIKNNHKIKVNNYFSFSLVRNPWDKVISAYLNHFIKLKPDFNNFLSWVEKSVEYEKDHDHFTYQDKRNKILTNTHFKEQYKFIYNDDNQIMVDYLGRFEYWNESFKKICELAKVEYREPEIYNKNNNRKHYSEYYNKKQADLIKKIYKKDIELFGYEYEKNNSRDKKA